LRQAGFFEKSMDFPRHVVVCPRFFKLREPARLSREVAPVQGFDGVPRRLAVSRYDTLIPKTV